MFDIPITNVYFCFSTETLSLYLPLPRLWSVNTFFFLFSPFLSFSNLSLSLFLCLVYILVIMWRVLLSCLEALGNMPVNQSRVEGNENVSPRYWRYCDYILVQFLSLLSTIFLVGKFFLALDCLMTFESCTCLIVLAQECECLHSCVPRLVHNSSKVSTSTLDENVN